MDSINNNINRFNGKYLKCVVSNYTSSKNYLGNSGSLIVIQPKSGKLNDVDWEQEYKNGNIHRNYVYLGNEFLASGFGFGAQYILEKAEWIVNDYDDTIGGLKQKDIDLNQKIEDEVAALWRELNKYVLIDGGHIEKTNIDFGNNMIVNTRDVILYGEEAQYKNLEVSSVVIAINGMKCQDSTVFMPIGSTIKNITVELNVFKNDSGGIYDIEVLHHFDDRDPEYEGTKVKYDLDTDILVDYDYAIHKVYYSKKVTDTFIVDSYKKDVIKSIYINVKATPEAEYKCYPGILRKYGFEILSSGNAIVDNVVNLNKHINVRPQYYAKCSENGLLDDIYFTKHQPLNSFIDYDTTSIRFDINEQMNNNHYIYVAIPRNFSVNKIYIIKNHTEKFNWTGAVSIIRNKPMTCVMTNNETPYYINYDIYYLYADKGFFEDPNSTYAVELHVTYDYIKDINIIDGEYNNKPEIIEDTNTIVLSSANKDTINDEEFNDIYWINYNNDYRPDIDSFKQKLESVSINGAVKH